MEMELDSIVHYEPNQFAYGYRS